MPAAAVDRDAVHQPVRDRDLALLFKDLGTLRTEAPLFGDVDELLWRGPTSEFAAWAGRIGDARARRARTRDSNW